VNRRWVVTVVLVSVGIATAVAVAAIVLRWERWSGPPALRSDARILFSALVPAEAPQLFNRYFAEQDMARADTLPQDIELSREELYGLPTSLRREYRGYFGVRHWVEAGCGPATPRTIVYDPENRDLTPLKEQVGFTGAIRQAGRMVDRTGCHDFGLAPGSLILFGLDPGDCEYNMQNSNLFDIDWTRVDLVDIQAQRLLSEPCLERDGLRTYERAVARVSTYVRRRNPEIAVFSQVSFRDNHPIDMLEGLSRVRDLVDGLYFSYPSNHEDIPCQYCSPEHLELFLENVR
jgi:hypothetical protein